MLRTAFLAGKLKYWHIFVFTLQSWFSDRKQLYYSWFLSHRTANWAIQRQYTFILKIGEILGPLRKMQPCLTIKLAKKLLKSFYFAFFFKGKISSLAMRMWINSELSVNDDAFQTIIECLKHACTGEMPPNSRSGHSFIHDPKVSSRVLLKTMILRLCFMLIFA